MPRSLRASEGGYCYHVLNRGNRRAEVFHKVGDYAAFLGLVAEASTRLPLPVLAYCLMPNHFHLVVRPDGDGDLSRWMHWLTTAHVRRYLRHYEGAGHVWQGRFKAFPCQDDDHLRTVVRYVERNPLRAGLVERAEDWPWSSLGTASASLERAPQLDSTRFERGPDWTERVNAPMTDAEAAAVSASIRRDRPFGSDSWVRTTAEKLGLESSLRNRGRPASRRPGEA
ncbi:MAG: transposase [Paludisphaera borealis]|uniref:REP-associated tyrosine transposase n=1 Tax=Paludisphaera borealis TaxID=1387353 RepID=UPI0028514D5C|nr:transposase [Paludisphaera borealis]MDR3619032.1 transposase [Paludisphaera borealis]